jgi:hypothetical protein
LGWKHSRPSACLGRPWTRVDAYFEPTIAEILRDEVGYARMTSGVTFELPDPPKVLARWRATVDAMLAEPKTDSGFAVDAGTR